MTAMDLAEGTGSDAMDKFLAELCQALAAAEAGEEGVRLTTRRSGPYAEVAKRFNALTHRQTELSKEMARVARAAGREGKLTERVELDGAGGLWADAAGSVNGLIDDLVRPTNEVARVISAVADGDLSQKMALQMDGHPVKGEFQRIGRVVNSMVDQLRSFADEVTRVAREVGTEGRLGGQADVHGASGTWKDLTDSVNVMASNLTDQVRNIALVTTAVANGDLSQKITVDARGEVAQLKQTVNTMVDQLRSFGDEVTRVAREVGTEGRLGGQADVHGASGTWKDLTDSVNVMASNLTDQVRSIAQVATAVARGDLSQKITVEAKGEVAILAETINSMTDTLGAFADEVTRVAREVGTEGRLGGQAEVPGVAGRWKDLTDSVNVMALNLTDQVRSIAQVTTAVARGDLTQKITVEAKGEVAALAETINSMTTTLGAFAAEVTRVAREVGIDGRLGGQAEVPGVSGTWKDLTDNVNQLAGNLTAQVRNIAQVTTAVAKGDLSQKITVDARGEISELKNTINTMVDQLGSFADEVTRVAREVGTEGRLGGQADVKDVSGTWKDLTDNVNQLAGNLTSQVRNIAQVTTAVARGDLSQKITVEALGEVAELKDTINTMVEQLSAFAGEVTRVAREVGTEGRLGGQADVPGVAGTWKALTDNVNQLAGNLTGQVRNIAQVTTAVARGDLSQKITVEALGEVAELKDTINTMVEQLRSFADEVTRVAREVGTDGRLGGQADVPGVAGTWKALTDSVNYMAANLTGQVRNIAQVTTAVAGGDLSQKITVEARGEVAELKDTINTMVDQLRGFADEVTRVAREVGTEGKLGGQATVPGVAGTWKDLTDNVNQLAGNLTGQVRNIAQVTTAVAKGDLTRKITVEVRGELLELKDTINTMVDQLGSFADEVTRVAREVGTEGKLGGQAEVRGISGTWKDLTVSVNSMADNLTDQVRNIAQVTTAVAQGDLSQKITVDARGEILQLKSTINKMVDQLSAFAAEVTRVAREVGTEGKLGGQAEVEGVSGTWKRLTESVNQLASNLTTQVRSIADVATAVTQGDLTRTITVDAAGEVGDLKDNINQMIVTLRETTKSNQDQDWLKSNLARIGAMLQGHRDLRALSQLIMSELTPLVQAQQGAFFMAEPGGDPDDAIFRLIAGYGYRAQSGLPSEWRTGEGMVGQAVIEKKTILVDVPPGAVRISTGLTEASPLNVVILPVVFEDQVLAVIELASFKPFSDLTRAFLEQIVETVGIVLNTIVATMRTEELLAQSQSLAQELQSQSEELQRQQRELQHTNAEIELARRELEERAEQLALSSKYKSEFLANMSHELRTPLNSLLILAKLLAENSDGTLSERHVEFAASIYDAGNDLLSLISDILDLSKVEAGKMDIAIAPVKVQSLCDDLEQVFRPIADQQALNFMVTVDHGAPESLTTDEHRVQQILKNLLSNALKFTERGTVALRVGRAPAGMRFGHPHLNAAEDVVVFSVSDTGIGIKPDQLMVIFEAFQQADGTTSRRYGGTGLGLSISREIARLLGGEIQVTSTPGEGSTFSLLLPVMAAVPSTLPAPAPVPAPGDRAVTPFGAHRSAGDRATDLSGRKVLMVDDDVRNLYALTSALEDHGLEVVCADSGAQGIELLTTTPGVELVLMDIMMPDMDGYQAIRRIRDIEAFQDLPIVALTAKAMRGDREESLAAGASDYVTKPVEIDQLLDTLRVWLHR
jgi:HAMP domain-containing protein/signal transduction histidine kinase/CheY-like chemotaxis protein